MSYIYETEGGLFKCLEKGKSLLSPLSGKACVVFEAFLGRRAAFQRVV